MSKTEDPTDQAVADAFDDLEAEEQHALVALAKTLGYSDPVQRARNAATSRRGFLGTVAGATAAGTMAYSAGKAQAGSSQVGTIGTDAKPVDVVAEDITADSTETDRLFTHARSAEWVVHNEGGTWYADGPSGTSGTSSADPAPALQHAADNATRSVKLADSVSDTNPISTTVTIPPGVSFFGPGVRGSAKAYGTADPVFLFDGGGMYGNLWVRGDANSNRGSNDLVVYRGLGRASLVQNINVFGTTGNGHVFEGCQQHTVFNIASAKTGDASADTGAFRFDNHPDDGLETNALEIYGIHAHGTGHLGSVIQMRASYGSGSDRPRNLTFHGLNMENGPQDSTVPVIEVSGRGNSFIGGRINGVDQSQWVFAHIGPRARDTLYEALEIIAETTNGTEVWRSGDNGTTVGTQALNRHAPIIRNCVVRCDGSAVHHDENANAGTPLSIEGLEVRNANKLVEVVAPQNGGPTVHIDGLRGDGTAQMDIQGAPISVSGLTDIGGWASQNTNFSPRVVRHDGSIRPLVNRTATTFSNGVAEVDFRGDFSWTSRPHIHAVTDRGTGYSVQGVSMNDASGNGDFDMVRANVVAADGSSAPSGETVWFTVGL